MKEKIKVRMENFTRFTAQEETFSPRFTPQWVF